MLLNYWHYTISKIIILAEPAEGHFNPFVPIIARLIERKHDVICITGRQFRQKVEHLGAVFHPLPKKWDPEEKEAYDFFPELKNLKGLAQIKYYLQHVMFDQVPDTLQCLNTVLKDFPADVVICDTFMLAGNWVTELGGPLSVRLSVLPLSLPGNSFFSKLRNNTARYIFENILFKDVQNHANKIRNRVNRF